jgi:hypothetical protein
MTSLASPLRRNAVAAALVLGAASHASWFDLPAGGASFKLLKLDAHPVALALSGAGAGSGSIDPVRNAAIDSVPTATLSAGYGRTYSRLDGSLQQVAWVLPSDSWSWNATARFQGFENIPGRDEDGRSTGTYAASAWALDAGLSVPLPLEGLRVGASLGAGMDMVAEANAFAGWLNLGTVYRPREARWSAGFALRNLGMGTTHAEELPAIVQVGGVWRQPIGNWTLVPMADAKWVADEDIQFPVALEARWSVLALRAGYVLGREEYLPSVGLGLDWENWILDAGTGWHDALGFAPALRLGIRI